MRLGLLFSVLLASCGATPNYNSDAKIVGGILSANQPYFVGLVRPGSTFTFCGGSLIDYKTVVTAAHCAKAYGANIQIKVGYDNSNRQAYNLLNVESVTSHPNYNSSTSENDIAVIKLKDYDSSQLLSPIEPIPLNDDDQLANDGWQGDIALYGTGATSASGAGAGSIFRTVKVPYIESSVCRRLYAGYSIFDSNLCAGNVISGGIDSCQGDSGGPAVVETQNGPVLVGVVSWGIGCADKKYPGVYTRASSFSAWVSNFL